ncbi:hypothetical protein G5714_018943 [Onychostoma macrolepis]|uniref:Uncharacterized protein n=1 Tax=Onychostoma macrolepis TaxID=369639 RepID=A0A7J6C0G8_9TELE|nr:hypothetical protein G5714_018943 [Onychostoma macrolepis]
MCLWLIISTSLFFLKKAEEEIEEKKMQLMKTQKDVQQLILKKIKNIQDIKHSAEIRKETLDEKITHTELKWMQYYAGTVCCLNYTRVHSS